MPHDFFVTIHGERGAEWERACGTRQFPIETPTPNFANLPGKPRSRVFMLALNQIDPPVMEKIVAHLAGKFKLTPEEAAVEIAGHGIPILEDDCSVLILNPQKWF